MPVRFMVLNPPVLDQHPPAFPGRFIQHVTVAVIQHEDGSLLVRGWHGGAVPMWSWTVAGHLARRGEVVLAEALVRQVVLRIG